MNTDSGVRRAPVGGGNGRTQYQIEVMAALAKEGSHVLFVVADRRALRDALDRLGRLGGDVRPMRSHARFGRGSVTVEDVNGVDRMRGRCFRKADLDHAVAERDDAPAIREATLLATRD